jgi:hypothetical protein
MKNKKTASSRRKISFAVDREEIDVNSDWVEAVMAAPTAADPSPKTAKLPHPLFDLPKNVGDASFVVQPEESATGAESATGQGCSSVEMPAAVVESSPAAESSPVEESARVEDSSTGAQSSTGEGNISGDEIATVEDTATGALQQRSWRPRTIHRITDGLTPGQYAVYQLMYEAGKSPSGDSSRIYAGGYADLRRLTGLSKRGIQNIVAELQSKLVIRVSQKPGHHRTETTAYVVPEAGSVVEVWWSNGWRYAVGKSKTLTSSAREVPQ